MEYIYGWGYCSFLYNYGIKVTLNGGRLLYIIEQMKSFVVQLYL